MINSFFDSILPILPSSVSKTDLQHLYDSCYPTCSFLIKKNVKCNEDCIVDKSYCIHHEPCSYIIQLGKNKGEMCNVVNCNKHKGIIQCSIISDEKKCVRTCETDQTICSFHKKELEYQKEIAKPVLSIRYHESGCFVIKGTVIVVDVIQNGIIGYLEYKNNKWNIMKETSDLIIEATNQYKVPFLQ